MVAKSERALPGAAVLHGAWGGTAESKKLLRLLREHTQVLQGEVLKRLITEDNGNSLALIDELRLYGAPFEAAEGCAILLLRLEEGFRDYGSLQDSVLEFAIHNIVEENLSPVFKYWHCKDSYGQLVYAVQMRSQSIPSAVSDAAGAISDSLCHAAERMEEHITVFLKGRVTIAWGAQIDNGGRLAPIYRIALQALRKRRMMRLAPDEIRSREKHAHAPLTERVQSYVRRHLGSDISLQSLAEHVYLHPVYLSKLYKEQTGEGIGDYIVRTKMEFAAKLLLADKDGKIFEIAAQVGFRNQSYFSQVFKKRFGMTPQQYRNLYIPVPM